MKYFGVPTCPYCGKRVNLIRTWSLKRQGEYQCPRCGGISNIFLSPLIYVFALLAVFAGGAVYFFHKFILDDISLTIVFQVIIPFVVFFLLSLFMVRLEKPVIKRVSKEEMSRKKRKNKNLEGRRAQAASPAQDDRMFYDTGDYLPKMDYRTGPLPELEEDQGMKIYPENVKKAPRAEMGKTSVVEIPPLSPQNAPKSPREDLERETVRRPVQAERKAAKPARSEQPAPAPKREPSHRSAAPQRTAAVKENARVSAPSPSTDDFFAKYDDPEYVERRLKELNEKRNREN